jgi:uncharacterized protein YcbK (DUF882 family)
MNDLTKNFDSSEFKCPCCGDTRMRQSTMDRLQRVRDKYGKPIAIVSGGGFRCASYDDSKSAHKEGMAADLDVPRGSLFRLIRYAMEEGFTGIGVKNHDGRWQLHLDDAPEIPGVRPREWFWTYP